MKKILKSNKGQAMTELVIVIPLLVLFFAAIFQFTVIMMRKIQLAMVEREVMLFLTSEKDKDKNSVQQVQAFANEMAQKTGISGAVTVKLDDDQKTSKDYENQGFEQNNDMGLLKKFTGTNVQLCYNHPLLNIFASVFGKNAINLQTNLFTATGGSLTFKAVGDIKLKKEYAQDNGQGTSGGSGNTGGEDTGRSGNPINGNEDDTSAGNN